MTDTALVILVIAAFGVLAIGAVALADYLVFRVFAVHIEQIDRVLFHVDD